MELDIKVHDCCFVQMQVVDVMASNQIKERTSVLQSNTQLPIRFETSETIEFWGTWATVAFGL
ncbi:hypothetical protein ACERZ8_09410 [Tateyamaria armeniaca]|uniref:Uncharacterized protein n=1 Tax=Tateyamaria armeniaca TaxID=2518930 RepID=A0ABW8USJ2_9RHOB